MTMISQIFILSRLLSYLLLSTPFVIAFSTGQFSNVREVDKTDPLTKITTPDYPPPTTTRRRIEGSARTRTMLIETIAAHCDYGYDPLKLRPVSYEKAADDKSTPNTSTSSTSITLDNDLLLFESLRSRRQELAEGIGRKYIARTQRGFLNVHDTYQSGPFATDNIVGQLGEGQIVTSISKFGDWIEHDAGGWSISRFEGFTWLEPLDE